MLAEDIQLRSGQAARIATGLPGDLFDAASIGFLTGYSYLINNAIYRAQELAACLGQYPLRNHAMLEWMPVTIDSGLLEPADGCTACPEACFQGFGFVHPAPVDLRGFTCVQNRITEPSFSDTLSIRLLEGNSIPYFYFAHDPFVDPHWNTVNKSTNGKITRQFVMWLYQPQLEKNYIRRYLSPLTLLPPTGPDAILYTAMQLRRQPSQLNFRLLLGAMTGSPVAVEHETIFDILPEQDNRRPVIITDRNSYHATKAVQPVVNVGETLVPGDLLFDGFEIAELSYQIPSWDDHVKLPGAFLGQADIPYLQLWLTPRPVVIDGEGRFTFDVGPHSGKYWDYVYAQNFALVEELRNMIGGRSSVVPFELFRERKLRYGGVVVRLRGELIQDVVPAVQRLPSFLPPHRSLILEIADPVPVSLLANPPACCAF